VIQIAFLRNVCTFERMTASPSNGSSDLRKRRVIGSVLLAVAVLALVHRYVPFEVDHLILPAIGVGLLVGSLLRKAWGLLIPGCIIFGIGIGQWVQRSSHYGPWSNHGQALFLFCLAGGFALITVLSALVFRRRELWPLWPAGFIAFTGLIRDGVDWLDYVRTLQPYWPFALLIVAIWLLVGRPSGGSKS
jgi:hypothetical protein